MEEPEVWMQLGFDALGMVRRSFEKAKVAYDKRGSEERADKENSVNVAKSLQLLNQAYDEVSAIWENDINV